jgi:hypothetical protein
MTAGKFLQFFLYNFVLVALVDLFDSIKTNFNKNRNKSRIQVKDPGHLGGAAFGLKSNRLTSSSDVSTVCPNPDSPNFGTIVS